MDTRIHVLTLIDRMSYAGGAERLARELALRIDPGRFRSTICTTHGLADDGQGGRSIAEVQASHVLLLPLERGRRFGTADWRALIAYLRNERVAVIHAHMFGSNVWGTVCGRAARVPVVVAHEHTWSFQGEPIRRLLDRHLIARFADTFVAVSQADRERMLAIEHIPPERVRLIPNGIDDLPEPTHDLRAELGIAPDARVMGALSVFRRQKRLDVLLRAAALLRQRFPDLILLIAGRGPEEEQLHALAAELGLVDTVRFLGVRADRAEILATVDVAVSCSDYEGSPLSIMEYMDAGRPIVATAVGGVPDLIQDGVHGRLIQPGSPHALADAIAQTLHDPGAPAMGARARERRRAEFRLDAMVRRIEDLYIELLERRDTKRRALTRSQIVG